MNAIGCVLTKRQFLNNDLWKFTPENEIIYNKESVTVNDWKLSKGAQSLSLQSISKKNIRASFAGFKIEELLGLVGAQEMGGGAINGDITVQNPLQDLRVSADLTVKNTQLYGEAIGDIDAEVNNLKEVTAYDIDFALKGAGNNAEIYGIYDLANPVDALNFDADIRALKLAPFQIFAEEFIENLHGTLVADAEISGNVNAPSLVGFVRAEKAGVTVKQLGTPIDFGEQRIELDGNAIHFTDFKLIDSTGNTGLINAYILTEDYRNYYYDLDISANNFLILDTESSDNDLYYGKMIVDATASVTGDLFSPIIEANASPKKGSDLTYVVPASSANIDYGEDVVTFVDGFDSVPAEGNKSFGYGAFASGAGIEFNRAT